MLLLILAFFVTANLHAQEEPPCDDPDCLTDWTKDTKTVQLPAAGDCPNCYVTYDYFYRECPSGVQLSFAGVTGTSGACEDCLYFIKLFAFEHMIKYAPPVYGPLFDDWQEDEQRHCMSNITAGVVSCYTWVNKSGATNPSWVSEYCETWECCWYEVTVCINENGEMESPYYDNQPQQVNCSEGCYNSCNYFDEKRSEDQKIDNMVKTDKNVKIIPNPSDGNLSIKFNEKSRGEYKIILYDLNGKVILSRKITNNSKEQSSETISLQGHNTGVYFYKIYHKDKVIKNGTIRLVK